MKPITLQAFVRHLETHGRLWVPSLATNLILELEASGYHGTPQEDGGYLYTLT